MSTNFLQSCGWYEKKIMFKPKLNLLWCSRAALRLVAWALSEFDYVDSISEALVEFDDDSLKDFDPTRSL